MVALMKSLCFSFVVLASIATLFSVADAHKFQVGGKGDWVEKPHEGYNSWAESKRFKVHDTIRKILSIVSSLYYEFYLYIYVIDCDQKY